VTESGLTETRLTDTGLTGKVAIVTGAATGIGKAIALDLAAAGVQVVVNHLDTPAQADAVVAQIRAQGGSAIAAQADVSSLHRASRHHGECGGARGHRHRELCGRPRRGAGQAVRRDVSVQPAGNRRGSRRGRDFSRVRASTVDHWAGTARQWRNGMTFSR